MAHSIGEVTMFITLYTSTLLDWAQPLITHLEAHGCQVKIDDTMALQPPLPDVILTTNTRDYDRIQAMLMKHDETQRPLLVMISDKSPAELNGDYSGPANSVLPPIPAYLAHYLQILVQMRADSAHLHKQITHLEQEKSQLQDDLEQQKRMTSQVEILKNAIVRNVSHELKTPLLHVKSAVSLLAEDVKDEKLISYATNATARLEALVKNITLLSTSLDINLSPVIVRDTIHYASRNVRRIWEYRDSTDRIEMEIQDGIPPIMADKQGISTVLQLLMENALKFSKDSITISATYDTTDQCVTIAVKDKGIGIAPDQLDAIFHTFYQVDSSSTRRYGGMGIGLAIVNLILDKHDSEIIVHSKEGKGSSFAFKLPTIAV